MRKTMIGGLVAAAVVYGLGSAASAADTASQKFIKEAMEGNFAEVQMGELAQKKGQSDGVRSFGKMLVDDHSAANEKAKAVASQIGATAPTGPNAKQKAMHDKMSKMSDSTFDREFAKEMVADHKKDISEFEKEAKKKNDPAATFANDTLPTLRKHLETAQSLAKDKSASR
jgi:putative membrane protein